MGTEDVPVILTVEECFTKGVQDFRDRLKSSPGLHENFVTWFDIERGNSLPDFLSHKKPSHWLELAGNEAMTKQLLIWFDNLPIKQQKLEAQYEIVALLEDNGHV
jgi:hypothetical protein